MYEDDDVIICPSRPDPTKFGGFESEGEVSQIQNVTFRRGKVIGSRYVFVKSVTDFYVATVNQENKFYNNAVFLDAIPGVLRHYARYNDDGDNHYMYENFDKQFLQYLKVEDLDTWTAAGSKFTRKKLKKKNTMSLSSPAPGVATAVQSPLRKMISIDTVDANFRNIIRSLVTTLRDCHNKKMVHGNINTSTIVFVGNFPMLMDFKGLEEGCKNSKGIKSVKGIKDGKDWNDDKHVEDQYLKDYKALARTLREGFLYKCSDDEDVVIPEELQLFMHLLENATTKEAFTNIEFHPFFLSSMERLDYGLLAYFSERSFWNTDPKNPDARRALFHTFMGRIMLPARNDGMVSWKVPAQSDNDVAAVLNYRGNTEAERKEYEEDALSFLRFWKNLSTHVQGDLRGDKDLLSSVLQKLWPHFLFELHGALVAVHEYIYIRHRRN